MMKYALLLSVLVIALALVVALPAGSREEQSEPKEGSQAPVVLKEPASAPLSQPPVRKVGNSTVETKGPSIRDLLRKGQTEVAIARLEEHLKKNPTDPSSLLTLAALYAKERNHRDKAEELLRRVLESNPENREALEKFLGLQYDSRQLGNPLESLHRLVEENPDSPNIAGAYARSLAAKGQYAEAIALFERALENPRADAFALESLAEYYQKVGQSGKAAEAFERAVKKQEEFLADLRGRNLPTADVEQSILRSQAVLARELLRSREFERAEALIRAIAAKDPNHPLLPSLRTQLQRERQI